MADHHITLAPGAREKVFIQKFYLYLNMTKPSDALYVTYSRVGADGKARRRSYLIKTLLGLFADLKVEEPADGKAEAGYLTPESSLPQRRRDQPCGHKSALRDDAGKQRHAAGAFSLLRIRTFPELWPCAERT